MANQKAPLLTPVDGVVFHRSILKTFGLVLLNVLLFCFCLFLIWAKVTHQVLDPGSDPKEVTWWGLLLAIAGVLAAPVLIKNLVRSLWVKRRLVIGPDRLQIVENRSDEIVVVLQIPYANIASFKYEATRTERRIGMDLRRLDDPETYAPKEKFELNKNTDGRHICFSGGYREGPKAISIIMAQAFEKWSGK